MKAQSLKNAILQLAVQGKLVAQNPQDEPASELLKKIKAEKMKLLKENKIKVEKPLAPITDEEKPFDIPESWEWVRLGTICTLNPRNALDDSTPVSFIPMSLIDDGYRSSFTFEKRLWKDVKSGFTHFSEGDIAVAKIIPCFDNRKSAIFVNLVNGVGAGTTELHIIRVIKETLLHNYVLWFLKTHYFINSGIKTYSGTAGQQRISKDFMENVLFPLPPLAEQQRIVEKIEQLMPLVEKYDSYEKELSALEAKFPSNLKKSVLQFAVQGKLVPQTNTDEPASELLKKIKAEKAKLIKEKKIKAEKPLAPITDEEKPFDIPERWEWVRLGMLMSVKGGKRIPKGKAFSDIATKHIYIRVADMKKHSITMDAVKHIDDAVFSEIKNYTISKDDLYLTIAGTIGSVGIVPDEFDNMNLTENAVKLCNILTSKNMLLCFIRSEFIQNQFVDKTNKVAQPKLAIERIMTTLIPLPPLSEQQRIVAKAEHILALCDVLADENKLKKHQLPKRSAKVIEFTPMQTEEEHEHIFAARADEINPETRAKELEHIAELRRKR